MEYEGKLYGKINGKYFDTGKTTKDYDNILKLIAKNTELIFKLSQKIDRLTKNSCDN